MAIDWGKILPAGIGVGATLLGSKLSADAANKGSEREWELIQQEMARRNAIQGQMAPTLGRALGMRNPATLQRFQSTLSGQPSGYPGTGGGGTTQVPPTPTSGTSKTLGAVGTGLGVAGAAGGAGLLGSLAAPTKTAIGGLTATGTTGGIPGALGLGGGSGLLGLGAATIPVLGGLIAGGAFAANKIGQGRRTANTATQGEGFEKQFVDALTRISAGQGTLQDLDNAYNNYTQGVNSYRAMGGKHKIVAEQSLANKPLQETYQRLRAQLGGQ
jgi:hypothetical protein